jgi:Dolichyl-phosphate-mannose-protein mannosyltransferase
MSKTNAMQGVARAPERVLAREAASSATALLLGLAFCKFFLHLLAINHYGFFRDELYYMACGEHLAWGYIDQPPLIALLAWIARHLFGESLVAIRLLPVVAGTAMVVLTGLFARELGGGRFAQFLAAATFLFAPAFLAFDSFFSMNAFEPPFWLVSAWLVVRIVKGGSPKLWLWVGMVSGIGLENKHSMLVFGFALIAGLLLSGEGKLFRSKWIWLGGFAALALFLPNLIWEAQHGWPQIEVVRNAQEFKNVPITPLHFLLEQLLFLNPVASPVWLAGLAWLFLSREGKRYRFLAWTYLIVLGIFMTFGGKTYYPLPVYPILIAAGGVAFEEFAKPPRRRSLGLAYPAILILSGLLSAPFGLPLLPVGEFLVLLQKVPYARAVKTERDATAALPQLYADMFGWDNMAETVARVYHEIPQSEQPGCAILAGNYGEAGAIDHYGPRLGLPKAISGHNNYYLWGPRGYSGECVVLFGEGSEEFKTFFSEVRLAAVVTNPHAMPVEQNVSIYICRKPVAPLSVLWPRFKLII